MKKNIALIPIDNRPICYSLIKNITDMEEEINLYMPQRKYLGGLQTSSNIDEILNWLQETENIDYLIIALDTIAYGGLVTSRRTNDSKETIEKRIEKLKEIIIKKKCKTYAFSSIMRISNNSINEEEKEYWTPFGSEIFKYSYNFHKSKKENLKDNYQHNIPKEILDDYLKTRERNFKINQKYLEMSKDGIFDLLVYSKDDTGRFGLNVMEAEELQNEIEKRKLNAILKTGADEIPLSLLSRAILDNRRKIKIAPIFLQKNTSLISKYEDISIFNCVKGQIELTNAEFIEDPNEADLIAFINNFSTEQGDLVLGDRINNIKDNFSFPKKPYFICDVNNANGADNSFIEEMFKFGLDKNFFGYCGYNTSANTIGCATCTGITKLMADKYNELAFKRLEYIRFMDDWAYQANIRKNGHDFKPFEEKINRFLNSNFTSIQISPWNRTFEIEIIPNE